MEKLLITGLGNKGDSYKNTRHNVGFKVLDTLAKKYAINFSYNIFGYIASIHYKNKIFILLKPDTFMNKSGKSIGYWLYKEKILLDKLLVVTDDINLKFSTLRLRTRGTYGGHNGLKNIEKTLKSIHYPRLRVGIENYSKENKKDFVLGEWSKEEYCELPKILLKSVDAILCFGFSGIDQTMNLFNC